MEKAGLLSNRLVHTENLPEQKVCHLTVNDTPYDRQRRIQILTGEENGVDWCDLKCLGVFFGFVFLGCFFFFLVQSFH